MQARYGIDRRDSTPHRRQRGKTRKRRSGTPKGFGIPGPRRSATSGAQNLVGFTICESSHCYIVPVQRWYGLWFRDWAGILCLLCIVAFTGERINHRHGVLFCVILSVKHNDGSSGEKVVRLSPLCACAVAFRSEHLAVRLVILGVLWFPPLSMSKSAAHWGHLFIPRMVRLAPPPPCMGNEMRKGGSQGRKGVQAISTPSRSGADKESDKDDDSTLRRGPGNTSMGMWMRSRTETRRNVCESL